MSKAIHTSKHLSVSMDYKKSSEFKADFDKLDHVYKSFKDDSLFKANKVFSPILQILLGLPDSNLLSIEKLPQKSLVKYQIFKQENGNEEILEIINVFDILYDKVKKLMQGIIEKGKYENIELSE